MNSFCQLLIGSVSQLDMKPMNRNISTALSSLEISMGSIQLCLTKRVTYSEVYVPSKEVSCRKDHTGISLKMTFTQSHPKNYGLKLNPEM